MVQQGPSSGNKVDWPAAGIFSKGMAKTAMTFTFPAVSGADCVGISIWNTTALYRGDPSSPPCGNSVHYESKSIGLDSGKFSLQYEHTILISVIPRSLEHSLTITGLASLAKVLFPENFREVVVSLSGHFIIYAWNVSLTQFWVNKGQTKR